MSGPAALPFSSSSPLSRLFASCLCALLLSGGQVLVSGSEADEIEQESHDLGLFNFVSRPDIKPPRWNLTVHDEAALEDGYWFLGPYKNLHEPENAGLGWIGPHIYDRKGELIYSGAPFTDNGNVEDFRVSNVLGEQMLTVMWQAASKGVLIDQTMTERDSIHFEGGINTHEFNFVENGTRALVVRTERMDATEEHLSQLDEDTEDIESCRIAWDGFVELEAGTWKETFRWRSSDWVGLDESTLTCNYPIEKRCNGWDYIHMNSIDKTPEGDFLISMRHADAVYKLSKDDGHVIWRMGGPKNDFDMGDLKFSRQHNIRHRGQNETHTFLSILDNAEAPDACAKTHDFPRGLLLAVQEEEKTVAVEAHYDHPYGPGGSTNKRGNYQVLPNGNVFMAWSKEAMHSEHSPNGTVLMEANLLTHWLGTYRSYKFPWVGKPSYPPDVASTSLGDDSENGTSTVVHVSWNGATEVAAWTVFRSTPDGDVLEPIVSHARAGFETALTFEGFAQYVVVQGLDSDDEVLGQSKVAETNATQGISAAAIAQDRAWQLNAGGAGHELSRGYARKSAFEFGGGGFLAGCVFTAIVALIVWVSRSGLWKEKLRLPFRFSRSSGKGVTDDGEPSQQPEYALLGEHRVEDGREKG